MAVPANTTTQDLSGTYTMNKTLSDSSQAILKMQNVPFIIRQAVQYSSIAVTLQQYADGRGTVHVDQEQVSTGGVRNNEERVLDNQVALRENKVWGKVRSRSSFIGLLSGTLFAGLICIFARFVHQNEIDDDYLREGWCREGELIESTNESVTDTWTVQQVWGFAEVDGQRRHVRKIVGKKGKQVERVRLVYEWKA